MIKANQEEKIKEVLSEIRTAKSKIHKPIVRGLVAKISENEIEIMKEVRVQRSI